MCCFVTFTVATKGALFVRSEFLVWEFLIMESKEN